MVLILVLVEDGLGAERVGGVNIKEIASLNPCFSGGWSRRVGGIEVKEIATLS